MKRILALATAALAAAARAVLEPFKAYAERQLVLYAYSGSTAASSVANPPACISQPLTRGSSALTGNKPQVWLYSSTNLTTDLTSANFFSDAWYLGMRPGDIVMGTQYTSAGSSVITFQGSIGSVTTAGAALSTGGTMTSTFT